MDGASATATAASTGAGVSSIIAVEAASNESPERIGAAGSGVHASVALNSVAGAWSRTGSSSPDGAASIDAGPTCSGSSTIDEDEMTSPCGSGSTAAFSSAGASGTATASDVAMGAKVAIGASVSRAASSSYCASISTDGADTSVGSISRLSGVASVVRTDSSTTGAGGTSDTGLMRPGAAKEPNSSFKSSELSS